MEAQRSVFGRGFQRLRFVLGSCDAWTRNPSQWSGCDLRYGWVNILIFFSDIPFKLVFLPLSLSLQQTWQFTPPFAKRIVDWLQDSVPLRIKGIHIINQPKIFQMVFALFKPFLREKLRNRIIFHGTDRESLHKQIAPKCLPLCYDGTIDLPVTFVTCLWGFCFVKLSFFLSSVLTEPNGINCSWNVIRNTSHSTTTATLKSEKPRRLRNATRVKSDASTHASTWAMVYT